MNFAQSMGAKPGGDADTPLRSVQIDGQVRDRSIARAHRETRSDPPSEKILRRALARASDAKRSRRRRLPPRASFPRSSPTSSSSSSRASLTPEPPPRPRPRPPPLLRRVRSQVVMKIVKHCTEQSPALVTGQLLGLDIGATLEVTDCFPFPNAPTRATAEADLADADALDEGANYQLEMMRCLREINVDNNTVGWYQSTYLGSFYTEELIETFLAYQENINRCVCVVYDPTRAASTGTFGLKALRLSEKFLKIHKAGEFTFEKLADKSISWAEIVCEVPLKISNSALVSAVMGELTKEVASEDVAGVTQSDLDRLSMSTNPFLEKSLEFLSECMDDLSSEQQKFSYYMRQHARQQLIASQWMTKRKQENAARQAAGQELLPEEDDPNNPAAKSASEPSRLEAFLIANQVNQYCEQISDFSEQSLQKLLLVSGARKEETA
jgi:translation initiation factor 3 subunit H